MLERLLLEEASVAEWERSWEEGSVEQWDLVLEEELDWG
jgi:hypothetical protein